MNDKFNDIPIIIPEGKYKGMRLYLENIYGAEQILPIEMYYLFQNAFKNDYKVFMLSCNPNHNISIPEKDLKFLNTPINDENIYLNHIFSNNVLKIKDLQHQDILKFYKIAIKKNQIDAFFLHPILKNNYYCFNIFLIVKKNFDLNEILNINFDLIKINSVVEYYSNTLTLDIMKTTYDLLNVQFKDYIIPDKEIKKISPYNDNELEEKKILDILYDKIHILYDKKKEIQINDINKNYDFFEIDKEIEILNKEIEIKRKAFFDKQDELRDIKLYIKLFSQKLCTQILIFNELIVSDTIFFTNFIQLVGGVSANYINEELKLSYDELQHYSLEDMYFNDSYQLYTVFVAVYYWKKKY